MQEHTFSYEGQSLHYITAGSPEAPPILMIHGYDSSHHVWRTTIPLLEKTMYCVAIDLLGHGDSPIDPKGDYSIEAQGRRVLALADELGLERFCLIGHSMGGQIALCIASMLAPERVEKVVDVAGVVTAKLTAFVERTVFRPVKMLYGTPLGYPANCTNARCLRVSNGRHAVSLHRGFMILTVWISIGGGLTVSWPINRGCGIRGITG